MAQQSPWTGGATADATGRAVVTFSARSAIPVRVDQVSGRMVGGAGAVCSLLFNGAYLSPLTPTGFAAGAGPPIWIGPGDALTVEWTGATPGLVAAITVIYSMGE